MINQLSVKNKKIIIILVVSAVVIPVLIFFASSLKSKPLEDTNFPIPTKEPLPTFPEAQRVEDELIIQYAQGQEFDNLAPERQQEILNIFQSYGIVSQEKAYPDVPEGELTRSYILKFNREVDIEEIAIKIYELPEIEGAQPNTEFGLF